LYQVRKLSSLNALRSTVSAKATRKHINAAKESENFVFFDLAKSFHLLLVIHKSVDDSILLIHCIIKFVKGQQSI